MQKDSLPFEPQGKPENSAVGSLSLLQGIFPTQELNRVSGFIALQVDSLPTELSEHNLSKIPVKSEFNWIHNWKNFLYSYTIKYQMICLT